MLGDNNESLIEKLTLIPEGAVEFWHGGIETEHLILRSLWAGTEKGHCKGWGTENAQEERIPQLCSGVSSGLGTCSEFQANICLGCLFLFFFHDFGISLGG